MRLLSRILAVVAASGIWLYIPSATQAAPDKYPVWPSFLSTGCTALQGPSGSTTIVCGQGAFLLTQVNSGYECNQLDINVTSFSSGPFTATGTVNSGSQSNTISINDTGNYYMQFPGFLVNNLITIQISAPDSGSMTIGYVATNPCPVATKTDTPNPSFTATNTPVPVTGTPTAIPTYTPLPSGHNTFTVTNTPTPGPTFTASPTPAPSEIDCGDITYPLLNCTGIGGDGVRNSIPPTHWFYNLGGSPTVLPICQFNGTDFTIDGGYPTPGQVCGQNVTPTVSGNVYIQFQWTRGFDSGGPGAWSANVGNSLTRIDTVSCPVGGGTWCVQSLGAVTGNTNSPLIFWVGTSGEHELTLDIAKTWVSSSANTPTPGPATSTPTIAAATETAIAAATQTALAASFTPTPLPIPGAMSTPIATSTDCPGGCAVAALTAVPGLSTITTVDTSPFSQLQHLSLARNGCTAFGYVQVPYPVIHGTPVLGSTTPLSVTWTLPVTHDWDNTQPFSNTAIEPCAMSEVPTFVWDFTYWLSVFACSVVFIMWLIGVIGRLSGDENING